MTKSTDINELAAALAKFQGEMEGITKDSSNPFFKSKYASLSAIIEDTRTPLAKNGLSYAQFPEGEAGLVTILMHTSGQWIQSEPYHMGPVDLKPQSVGSAITYARRYALCAILGLQVEDDDGNEATKPAVVSSPKIASKPAPTPTVERDAMRVKLYALLKARGVDVEDARACREYVATETQLNLVPINYDSIIAKLESKLTNKLESKLTNNHYYDGHTTT